MAEPCFLVVGFVTGRPGGRAYAAQMSPVFLRSVDQSRPPLPGGRRLWTAFGAMGLLLVVYAISVAVRGPDGSNLILDGWMVAGFEAVVAVLCLSRAITLHRGKAVPLALGLASLFWATGDLTLTGESMGGANVPTPSLADLFYLGFFPLCYVGVLLLLRRHVKQLIPANWLDGVVAGLGAAALCSAFAFNTLLHSLGGGPLAVTTNLAYPIGDVLLLGLVIGGTALLPSRRNPQWFLLAGALVVNAAGDTSNLLGNVSAVESFLNVIAWPVSLLLIAVSVWLRPVYPDPLARERAPGFLLPAVGSGAGLTILVAASLHPISRVALALATATLVTVGVRLWLSVGRLRALTEERHRQAVTDELTGLGNRRHLFQLLDAFFADQTDPETPRRQLAFLYIDLDRFKEINDSYGHSIGDKLLKQLGPRLAGALRATDVLVRVGGDELGVILLDTHPSYAEAVAERIVAKLEEPFILNSVRVRISASIGMAAAPADANDSTDLIRCADLAMYRAKVGKPAFVAYDRQIDDEGGRLRLVEELREAIDDKEQLVLHFQPQIRLTTGAVTAVEALVRWNHPRLGLVPPLDFLPLAEEAGLMRPLTELVLDQALAQCAVWRAAGRELAVSVNISAGNLLDPDLASLVGESLARHGVPASALILEITETVIMRDLEQAGRAVAELRDLGVMMSIDDFGAGFTSLAYLASLAVAELKLDRSFICGLTAGGGERDLAVVRASIDLGHALGLRVVAEGIEDQATLRLIWSLGCDLAQGYYISRPKPAGELGLGSGSASGEIGALKAS